MAEKEEEIKIPEHDGVDDSMNSIVEQLLANGKVKAKIDAYKQAQKTETARNSDGKSRTIEEATGESKAAFKAFIQTIDELTKKSPGFDKFVDKYIEKYDANHLYMDRSYVVQQIAKHVYIEAAKPRKNAKIEQEIAPSMAGQLAVPEALQDFAKHIVAVADGENVQVPATRETSSGKFLS